jgi:hypothetical protein
MIWLPVQAEMSQVTRSVPGSPVQQAFHPAVRSLMRKYAVSASEEVFPAPKQLPVIWTVWVAVAPNAPTVTIAGVHAGGGGDGDEDGDLDVEGECECDIEGAADVEGAGDVEGASGEEESGDGEGDGEGEGDAEGEGDGEGDVETSVVGVPVG